MRLDTRLLNIIGLLANVHVGDQIFWKILVLGYQFIRSWRTIIVCNHKRCKCNLIVCYIRQGQGACSKRVASSKPWQSKSSRCLILVKFVMKFYDGRL